MNFNTTLTTIYDTINANRLSFLGTFFFVALTTYLFLVIIDFVPEPVAASEEIEVEEEVEEVEVFEETPEVVVEEVVQPTEVAALPTKIIFDSLDKEVDVLNPTSRAVADLDAALLSGAVRHPDSADFANPGNIFILAHSSYLPSVRNKNFQAFNGIQNLVWGDTIRVQSDDMEYTYRVDKVYKATTSEVTVPLDSSKKRLTLATCNSFGSKNDRFIVESTLIKEEVL